MKLFLSWSGPRSQQVASALRQWIPDVIQSVEPWMSRADIEAGARWSREIAAELAETQLGIICLTRENQAAPWILFEAGALAKTVSETFVCPYLIDLPPTEIAQGPLTQFQAKQATIDETWELVQTINRALKEGAIDQDRLRRSFERFWPDLQAVLDSLPVHGGPTRTRSVDEMVREILETVRSLNRRTPAEPVPDPVAWEALLNYVAHSPEPVSPAELEQIIYSFRQSDRSDFVRRVRGKVDQIFKTLPPETHMETGGE